jgi:hypothetical protein
VAINRLKLFVSGIIPGNWGKAGSGWLAGLLLNRTERGGRGGRIHQFLWHVRTCQMRMRDLAARSDEKLLRTESSSPNRFRVWANRSYPEGIRLLLCISTVRATLAVRRKPDPLGKAVERRTKWAPTPGRTRGQGKSREKLPSAGDVKNDTAGL